ncbi:MAG: hypothetical protein GY720_23355 [bacterium]|nr:hypothetical protein [bacterium]
MNEIPAQPPPPPVPAAGSPRRVYFEQLTAALLSRGLSGDRIGELVAELDQHVAMSGTDPVDELGPVGELADALADADTERTPWKWLFGNVAFGLLAGAIVALVLAMFFDSPTEGAVGVDLGIIVYMGVLMLGILLLRMFGSTSLVGKSTFELPAKKYFVPYIVVVAVVTAATQGLEWSTTTGIAWALLAVTVPLSAGLAIWSVRRSRIPVPGNVRHLRHLGWGFFGR